MLSLTYASRPLIQPFDRERQLADIQAVSIARNSRLEITGLLIASPDFFVQVLEGPAAAVDLVMASILADPRHRDLRVVRRSEAAERRLPRWSMACFDSASFGNDAITPLLTAVHAQRDPDAMRRLDRLIEALALDGVNTRP